MSCEHEAQVQAYHDGELSPQARASVEAHLRDCADCQSLLDELRAVSRLLKEAPLPEMREAAVGRFYGAWHRAAANGDRAVRRITGWLTAAAAAVLIVGLVRTPGQSTAVADARVDAWELEAAAVAPTPDPSREDAGSGSVQLVQVAQWMAQDLSHGR
jgi:anti-sigma factor RsiW